ncbi:DUF4215 domain-containing protein [Myxococcota bacterium]|nr:DUF4215 domain-containing protein [Myxococcota bacterium]
MIRARSAALALLVASSTVACLDALPPKARLVAILPDNGPTELTMPVTILGEGFPRVVTTDFVDPASTRVDADLTVRLGQFDLIGARVTSESTIEATVPIGLSLGIHELTVIDAFGRTTRMLGAYRVREAACIDIALSAGGSVDCEACAALRGCGCDATSECVPSCGDGIPRAPEVCDDGNQDADDGCSADCLVEPGYECVAEPSNCRSTCGDGERASDEACDDGDGVAGDGCNADCVIERGYTCTGELGLPSLCGPLCGDGQVGPGERCDDGNTDALDGCSATCTREPGFTCPPAGGRCAPFCGDGLVRGDEVCDDGNITAGDGCTPGCDVERGYTCAVPSAPCFTTCGDGLVAGFETCDDGNNLGLDGCSQSCSVEPGWSCLVEDTPCLSICGDGLLTIAETCDDGGATSGDGCSSVCAVEPGWSCAGAPSRCAITCGDGELVGAETCDDGNGSSGDGCSFTCTIERGYTCPTVNAPCVTECGDGIVAGVERCDDGNTTSGDGCSATCALEGGWVCPVEGIACAPACGDLMLVGVEACDDGNVASGDGCSERCDLEPGWTCSGVGATCRTTCGDGVRAGAEGCDDGNVASADGCTLGCVIEVGWTCPQAGLQCAPLCGDRRIVGAETCDDGNPASGDGCSSACAVELGWRCSIPGAACTAICGDARLAGPETCDDANTTNGDGCASTCTIEQGWSCPLLGLACAETCGDGRLVGDETCDDGNPDANDGCSATCGIEPGWTCGAPGIACATICGDALVRGAELCDDGNTTSGDGCDADCRPSCGNGQLDAGEACDDGNYSSGDACEADCTLPVCGNAITDLDEECDDGNTLEGDGCDSNCTTSRCGNAIAGLGEECDDGNGTDGDGCNLDCTFTRTDATLADATPLQWTPSTGTVHSAVLTAGCNATTSLSTSIVGGRDTFVASLASVPNGAIISGVELVPCAATIGGGTASLVVFTRIDGVERASAPILVGGATQTSLGVVAFAGLDVVKTPATTLHVGLELAAGAGGLRVSGLGVRVRYGARAFPAPSALTATYLGGGDVQLSWIDETTWESGFRVERSAGVPGLWRIGTTTLTTGHADLTSARDGLLPEDQTFHYRVRAFESATAVTSDWSPVVRVITAEHPPAAPMNALLTIDVAGAVLSWVDKSSNEEGFAIELSVDGGPFTAIAAVDADAESITDASCDPATHTCAYRVRAFNVIGVSGWSNVASSAPIVGVGPNVSVSVTSSYQSVVGRQSNIFHVAYSNAGNTSATNLVLETRIAAPGTLSTALSSAEWRCHDPAADHHELVLQTGRVLRALRRRYPNVKQVLLSPHPYAGYAANTAFITELFAYEGGHAVRRVIHSQIEQHRSGAIDPLVGDLDHQTGAAPWVAWGPYLWANGLAANGLGTTWPLADYEADRSRFSASGLARIATSMNLYFLGTAWTDWYRVTTVPLAPYNTVAPSATPALFDFAPGQRYLGLAGGLWADGSNVVPADHLASGLAAAAEIQPRAPDGTPSPSGKIVVLGLGYGHVGPMMTSFVGTARADARVRPIDSVATPATLAIVDGTNAAGYAASLAELESPVQTAIDAALGSYTRSQVQVVWLMIANPVTATSGVTLARTGEGASCVAYVGTLAPGASGTIDFTINTAFARSTAVTLSVTAVDDGANGSDANPADNTGQTSFAAPICRVPGGPGCT